jgi:hypothetical protein
LNKLEFPSPKNNLFQVGLLILEKKIFKIFSAFLLLEKGNPFHLNKLETPPPKDDLCQVWLKLAQWFWRRSRKCKSLQTDGQTDVQTDGQTDGQRIKGDQNSSLELSAQVSL